MRHLLPVFEMCSSTGVLSATILPDTSHLAFAGKTIKALVPRLVPSVRARP